MTYLLGRIGNNTARKDIGDTNEEGTQGGAFATVYQRAGGVGREEEQDVDEEEVAEECSRGAKQTRGEEGRKEGRRE